MVGLRSSGDTGQELTNRKPGMSVRSKWAEKLSHCEYNMVAFVSTVVDSEF
jgi:hypothetical protein